MDAESFLQLANSVEKLQMFPWFFLANAIIECLYVKEDLQAGAHLFSRKHPICCYITCLFSIYGGAMFASLLLGEPIIACITSNNSLLLSSAAWYLVFYMPFDFGYKVCKFLPVKIILCILKEVIRCKKVNDGVNHANALYPNSFAIMLIIGVIKGNGSAFLKVLERLLRGLCTPSSELLTLSYPTKSCIAASIVFILDKTTDLIAAPHSLVYFLVIISFVYFKLSSMLLGIMDPFTPFENIFCTIFLGGVFDTLQRLLTPVSKGDQTSVNTDTAKDGKTESAKKKE